MVDRRTALKLGSAGAISSMASLPGFSFAMNKHNSVNSPSQAFFDSRYTESQAFADVFKTSNIITTDINGNIDTLWYGQLRNQLLNERQTLFGLTDRLDLFCLEELARDVGMKVSVRVDHLIHQNGLIEHQIAGSASFNKSLKHLGHEAGFGKTMAELSEHLLNNQFPDASVQKLSGPNAPFNKTALVAWVIS